MAESGGRRGLGRGLSALLGESDAPPVEGAPPDAPPREVAIELLRRNPDKPRRFFPELELDELAASIREKGVLQPLVVRPMPDAAGEYQIVAGERRWRAAPVLVRSDLTDLDVLEIGIIENVQRADLNPLEEAFAYRTLIDQFGRTQEQVAETVGKSRSHVANTLRLLALPEVVQQHLVSGKLSAGHARAIATAPNAAELAERVVERGLSVRQAEALARTEASPAAPARSKATGGRGKDPDTRALEMDLSDAVGLPVEIEDRDGRGSVTIRYETLEQLDELCRRLSR